MVHITVDYLGQLRCRAIHAPSQTQLETDAPLDNHGRGELFSPTDLVATALGTCMATLMGIAAERHGIDLLGLHIEVKKEMSSAPPRRIGKLEVTIDVPLPSSHPKRALLEQAALSCPVHHSLHPEIEKPVTFHWKDESA